MCKYDYVVLETNFPVVGPTTVCVIKTHFGVAITGTSTCLNPRKWREDKAMAAAQSDAKRKLSELMQFKTAYNVWAKESRAAKDTSEQNDNLQNDVLKKFKAYLISSPFCRDYSFSEAPENIMTVYMDYECDVDKIKESEFYSDFIQAGYEVDFEINS